MVLVLLTSLIVEIITSSNSRGPSRDWLKIVKTSQAKKKINDWFKKENRDDNILKGREMVERELKKSGISVKTFSTPLTVNLISPLNKDTKTRHHPTVLLKVNLPKT